MNINFTMTPSKNDISVIYNGLLEFNKSKLVNLNVKDFGLFVRDEKGVTIGGLTGKIQEKSFHIMYFWLSVNIRGNGIGTELIHRMEQEAMSHGICRVYLDTFTFQATHFYECLGYIEVGRYIDFPVNNIDKVFYQKTLKR